MMVPSPTLSTSTAQSRVWRLLRLISVRRAAEDRDAYSELPPRHEEFSGDADPLAWDADGWEGIC